MISLMLLFYQELSGWYSFCSNLPWILYNIKQLILQLNCVCKDENNKIVKDICLRKYCICYFCFNYRKF